MGKKRYFPKARFWQKFFQDEKKHPYALLQFCIRLGAIMASDFEGEIKDEVYILPCLCFHFNHSEIVVRAAWLNIECWMRYKNWEVEDYYNNK